MKIMKLTICTLCGRLGQRDFTILSGNGDGTRDSYRCGNIKACEHRQRVEARPTMRSLEDEAERLIRHAATDHLPVDAGVIGEMHGLLQEARRIGRRHG